MLTTTLIKNVLWIYFFIAFFKPFSIIWIPFSISIWALFHMRLEIKENWKVPVAINANEVSCQNCQGHNLLKNSNSSVIRRESQNGCFRKTKPPKFCEKRIFLTPWYAHVHVRSGGKKCLFSGKFDLLCFLETPVLRFTLLPYYRRINCLEFKFGF